MLESARRLIVSLAPGVFLATFLSRASAGEPSPTFALSLGPCPESIEARPGESWEREIGVILTTAANPDPRLGANNWSISMTADGGDITLNHLFLGEGPPPFPGPTVCGVDPTADALAPCVYERCGTDPGIP